MHVSVSPICLSVSLCLLHPNARHVKEMGDGGRLQRLDQFEVSVSSPTVCALWRGKTTCVCTYIYVCVDAYSYVCVCVCICVCVCVYVCECHMQVCVCVCVYVCVCMCVCVYVCLRVLLMLCDEVCVL